MQKIICKQFSAQPTVTACGHRSSRRPTGARAGRTGLTRTSPARLGRVGPDPAGEFPGRLGDEIDDRVAEVLSEILGEQPGRRPGPNLALAAFGLLAALAATVVLRDSVAAVCVVWPSA